MLHLSSRKQAVINLNTNWKELIKQEVVMASVYLHFYSSTSSSVKRQEKKWLI